MSEAERLFFIIALFNTAIGLNNYEENEIQINRQKTLEDKLDRIIDLLESRD